MIQISIREKLILYFVLLCLFVTAIVGFYSYVNAKKALLERTFDQLTSLRLEKKKRIEQFFNDRNRDIYWLSHSGEIEKIFSKLKLKEISETIDNEGIIDNKYLFNFLSSSHFLNKMWIINYNKNNWQIEADTIYKILKYNNISDIKLIFHPLISQVFQSKKSKIMDISSDNKNLFIAFPILDPESNVQSVIVLEMSIIEIDKIMFENNEFNGLGKTGETYLVGNDYFMRSSSRFHENSILQTKAKTNAVISAFKNKSGRFISNDYRNISCLSSFCKIDTPDLQWVILAEIDESEAMIPIYNIRNHIIIISVFISVIVFFIAYLFSLQITKPLLRLQKSAVELRIDNFPPQLPISSNDEIGILTMAFNNMTLLLEKQSHEIVNERFMRLRSLLDGQEMERKRLSRELHDGVGQLLIALQLRMESVADKNCEISLEINQIIPLLHNIIDEIRSISNNLMPPVLLEFGIVKAIRGLCEDVAYSSSIIINFESNNFPEKLENRLETYLYRIVQEALNNCVKHSKSTNINISMKHENKLLIVKISDNGVGFHSENRKNTEKRGLYNMSERAGLLGGAFSVVSENQQGTTVTVEIPIL